MTPASAYTSSYERRPVSPGPIARAEAWLDERGRGAWIAAAVVGFIFIWPIGLALLLYMIFAKGMFAGSCKARVVSHHRRRSGGTSGNRAFDAYRDETLRRLEDEQKSFEDFLDRLRDAKDKAEFDQFMDSRATRATDTTEVDESDK